MEVGISKDLITQLQISLRKQANVPSYDPNDPSLPGLPSFLHSVDDSPRLRCHHCKARLLRGSDSLLCIFCGNRPTETPPLPIKFQSTSGYRWFLHSLNLDGSEIVGESLDGNGRDKERREESSLSDILGLEIRWNDSEPERFDSGLRKNNPLNLAGLDLGDDFLAERKEDSDPIPSEGTSAVKKGIGSTGSTVLVESPGNFQGSVSGWQADFQSSDYRADQGAISSACFDPYVSSSKDISSNMGMVLGQGTSLFDGKEKSNQTSLDSKTPDWFQGDFKSNSISGDQAQSSTSNAPGDRTIDVDDDSFDDWNDFKGSTIAQDVAHSSDQTSGGLKSIHEKGSSADLSTHMDSVFGTGDFFEGKAVDNTTSSHSSNWFQDDLWGSSTSKTVHHAEQSNENVGDKDGRTLANINNSSVSINKVQDDQWPLSRVEAADSGTNDEDDDSFGAWNDFKSSSVLNSSISSSNEHSIHATTELKSSDPFSGWNPEFQYTNSENNHVDSKSSDPFVGSSVDLSDHIDTVFASGKDLFDGKAKDSSNASDANRWFQDDLWSNSTSNLTHQAENLDATGNSMDSGTARGVHDPPSMDVDWFPDDQWLTGNQKPSDAKPIDESDDSFGDWFDFKSSTTKQDSLSNSSKQVVRTDNQTIDDNNSLSAAWNDFSSSTRVKDPSSISVEQNAVHQEMPSLETSGNNNFGSLSQHDFFSGAFSNQNGSSKTNIFWSAAPLSDWMGDANVRGSSKGEGAKDGDVCNATASTTGSKSDEIERLMLQMHDLSFMLESDLSIPAKRD
ncbi:Detected protein of unknown function [Hibiscus syriacus]|uniref:DUF7815 domain-containing protein n=1 Tax=Hibiscus syriacus TaxID=106335 RepID=A0A6A2XCQ7_HIBSY|nr:dentin sialophosphoprotein-like [Hibiscus syriacus]KAE8673062.1 Detected protein of unknown function [Hibiscus syriacus]